MPLPTAAATALVVGRYAGTVGVLADILDGGGVGVVATAALDSCGRIGVRRALADRRGAVVVVTATPGDDTLGMVLAAVAPDRVVAVTWHPDDERPALPPGVAIVVAGSITCDLARAVVSSW